MSKIGRVLFAHLLIVSMILTLVFIHELVHKAIYETYGVKAKIIFSKCCAKTVPSMKDLSKLSDAEKQQLNFLNSLNEIVGYYTIFFFVIWCTFKLAEYL